MVTSSSVWLRSMVVACAALRVPVLAVIPDLSTGSGRGYGYGYGYGYG